MFPKVFLELILHAKFPRANDWILKMRSIDRILEEEFIAEWIYFTGPYWTA